MSIVLSTPGADDLVDAVGALRAWHFDGAPLQLHPGDLGWFWQLGAAALAARVRLWSEDGRILAIALLDTPDLLRLAIAPDGQDDLRLANQLAADIAQPARGVLPPGKVYLEARSAELLRGLLFEAGWQPDEPWTALSRDLTVPVEDCGIRIVVVGPEQAACRAAAQRAAFDGATFDEHRWQLMAAGLPYAEARCLLGHDEDDNVVAAVTVWSAGPGGPGLLEPMGVHRDHRGRGHGRAITLAAASALRELGSSSAMVGAESSNLGAVATYRSAGYEPLPDVRDLRRGR